MIEVSDDSGFLGILDPDGYESFVAADWELEQLTAHFRIQMRRERLLLWGTGCEGLWLVDVRRAPSGITGFREVTGTIESSAGRLALTNYESLTMAAQFEDVTLPQTHEQDQVLEVPRGRYRCRVVQFQDPDQELDEERVGFVVELTPTNEPHAAWDAFPWSDL